jgi:hypothetical protein
MHSSQPHFAAFFKPRSRFVRASKWLIRKNAMGTTKPRNDPKIKTVQPPEGRIYPVNP